MKKSIKVIAIVVLTLMLATLIGTTVFAQTLTPDSLSGGTVNGTANTKITSVGKSIVAVIQTVGVVIAVVIMLVLGIKYMLGSAEEKAEYKKSMVPYIVGAVLIFAGTTIVNIVYNFVLGLK